jgi:hypothetical protein
MIKPCKQLCGGEEKEMITTHELYDEINRASDGVNERAGVERGWQRASDGVPLVGMDEFNMAVSCDVEDED